MLDEADRGSVSRSRPSVYVGDHIVGESGGKSLDVDDGLVL